MFATTYLRETYDPHAGDSEEFKIKPSTSGKFVVSTPKEKKKLSKKKRKGSLDLKCTVQEIRTACDDQDVTKTQRITEREADLVF